MRILIAFLLLCFPATAFAEDYGVGVVCPHPDTQITFYMENDQQDAAGTLSYDATGGFSVTSDTLKDFKNSGAHVLPTLCDNGVAGIRIDSKRDGWLQAGHIFLPPNQEWDYGDWQDYLRKVAVWKAYQDTPLYRGSLEMPDKEQTYADVTVSPRAEIYPLKFFEDYALVLVDETGAFEKTCAGNPQPPRGRLGWVRLNTEDNHPLFVPAHFKPC